MKRKTEEKTDSKQMQLDYLLDVSNTIKTTPSLTPRQTKLKECNEKVSNFIFSARALSSYF
jgi:hypothetical protein